MIYKKIITISSIIAMLASFMMCSSMFFPTALHGAHNTSGCHASFPTEHIKHFQSLSLATAPSFISDLMQTLLLVILFSIFSHLVRGLISLSKKLQLFSRLIFEPPSFSIIEFLISTSSPRSPPLFLYL